jgi:hypothetical protein
VTLFAQADRLESELDSLRLGDFGCAPDRRRFLLDDDELSVLP